jgi:fluoroquinolone transport system permease protein
MRLKTLILGDLAFQFKYGFYFLYAVITVLYIGMLALIPNSWRDRFAVLLIFSDPAALGLYFMGAIVLFEKSQRVLDSIAISPVKPVEYVLSKLISVAVISTIVGLTIALGVGLSMNIVSFVIALFFSSCLFSSIGLMIAAKTSTLNRFILSTIPIEIITILPAAAYVFGWRPLWGLLHPGISMMEVCFQGPNTYVGIGILFTWAILFAVWAVAVIRRMFLSVGGVTL